MVVVDEQRNFAATRNAGVAASIGEVVVTIDADTVMHPDALAEVSHLVDSRATGRSPIHGCFSRMNPRPPSQLTAFVIR